MKYFVKACEVFGLDETLKEELDKLRKSLLELLGDNKQGVAYDA